jgi:hypothetical protein
MRLKLKTWMNPQEYKIIPCYCCKNKKYDINTEDCPICYGDGELYQKQC